MKKSLNKLFNEYMKNELMLMFGDKVQIKVNTIDFSTQQKSCIVDVTLITNNYNEEELKEFYPEGLNMVINDCWEFLGVKNPVIVVSSIEII